VVSSAGVAHADAEPPGAPGLELKVDRLERAEQADVVGSESSAMLFAPEADRALAAAAGLRASVRAEQVSGLFLGPAVPLRLPRTPEALFGPGSSLVASPTTRGAAATDGASVAVSPGSTARSGGAGPGTGTNAAGAGAALLADGLLTSVVREQKEEPWTATWT
jgi:hypothetical protein